MNREEGYLKMLKTVIFDFDGTIVDSGRLVFDLFNEFADKYNYEKVPEHDIELIRSLSVRDRFKRLNVSLVKVPLITMDVVKKYKESIPYLKVDEDIKGVIKELKNSGLQLILISSNSKENIQKFLRLNEIEYFDDILTVNRMFGRHITINSFIKNVKIHKEEIIFVGDEHRDIEACQKTNVKIISVTWGYDLEPFLEKSNPDYIAKKPVDILEIIKELRV